MTREETIALKQEFCEDATIDKHYIGKALIMVLEQKSLERVRDNNLVRILSADRQQ